jgi:membrane protein YqaA with SNARE-associated domain
MKSSVLGGAVSYALKRFAFLYRTTKNVANTRNVYEK